MSYTDDAQTPEETSRQRQTIIIIIAIAALVLIAGCVGLYFFVGNNPAATQGTSVVQIPTSLPSPTPSLTPIPSATLEATPEDGTGGGGEGETETPTATNTDVPAIRTATLSEIRGTVQIKTAASSDWVTVLGDQAILEGTTILVSEASSVKLTMTEGTIVRISPQTQIKLTEMHGTTLDPITKINIDFGKVWTIVGGGDLGFGKFEVETPLGVASVVGTFMGVEHNSSSQPLPLDIITCLEGQCRYSNTFGVLNMGTLQQLFTDGSAVPGPAGPMDPDQVDSWSPTRVPEVITLTPTITPTFTPSSTRTPTLTRTPVNTPNLTSTSGAASTSSAQTSTAAAGNLTSTVFFINATATAGAGSTSGARTA
ncbi:MAG: FecR domain-containing protein, partial [Chloroflexota bacterium]